jgi:hypothetical protein
MTVRFDILPNGTDRTYCERWVDGKMVTMLRPGNWQVIFKNSKGQDYCRETKPGSWSRNQIETWARNAIEHQNVVITDAVIERW